MNTEDRIAHIQASRKEIASSMPSPEQIALEQALELDASKIVVAEKLTATIRQLQETLPVNLEKLLRQHSIEESQNRNRLLGEVTKAVLPAIPKDRSADILHSISVWCVVVLTAICIAASILYFRR